MRLSQFISRNAEAILVEPEGSAATLVPAAGVMSFLELRHHAPILQGIARRLVYTLRTADQQAGKSEGLALTLEGTPDTAGQAHVVTRARRGFDLHRLCADTGCCGLER